MSVDAAPRVAAAGSSFASSWAYRPHLDGLRAVAVYLVVVFHARLPGFAGGFIGVDVFFVLSGFVVTGVLLTEYAQRGGVRLRDFYARRARRLLPAAAVTLLVMAVVLRLGAGPYERVVRLPDVVSAAVYVSNWHFIAEATDYFGSDIAASPVLHFWSLSVEEQFYIVWPVLLLGLLWLGRRGRAVVSPRRLLVLVGGLALASLVGMLVVARGDVMRAYYGTDMRAYQLLTGAGVAVAASTGWIRVRRVGWLAWLGLGILLMAGTSAWTMAPTSRGVVAMAATTTVIWATEAAPRGALARGLARRVPVRLGEVSYGTYLWHWPLAVLLARADLPVSWRWVLVAGGATLVAAVSYRSLEMPVRSAGVGRQWPGRLVLVGATTSVLVGGAAFALLGTGVDAIDIDWEAASKDTVPHVNCFEEDVAACRVVEGTVGSLVMLVGDSHAAHLLPALEQAAKEHDFSLSAATLGSCPWADIGVRRDRGSRVACDDFRRDLFGRVLPALEADVIVLANRALFRGTLERADGSPVPVDAPDRGTVVASAIRRSVVQYDAVGSVVVVDPMPDAGSNVPSCLSLSARPQSCDFQVAGPRAGAGMLDAATEGGAPGTSVDLLPAVCPEAPTCRAVRDGVVTRADSHHLTATYSQARAEEIWRRIREAWRADQGRRATSVATTGGPARSTVGTRR